MRNRKKKLCRYGMKYRHCEQYTCTYYMNDGGCSLEHKTDIVTAIKNTGKTFSGQKEEVKQYTLKF